MNKPTKIIQNKRTKFLQNIQTRTKLFQSVNTLSSVYDPQSYYTNFSNAVHDLDSYVYVVDDTSLYSVNCKITGIDTTALLDSGSGVTIMTTQTYNQIPSAQRPTLMRYTGRHLKSASGHRINVTGFCHMPISFNDYSCELKFLIVDKFPYAALLGNDAFIRLDCFLNFRRRIIFNLEGLEFPMIRNQTNNAPNLHNDEVSRVRLLNTIRIPPRSLVITIGLCETSLEGSVLLLEHHPDSSILVQRTVCNQRTDRKVPITIVNTSMNHTLKISRGQMIAWAEPIDPACLAIVLSPFAEFQQIPRRL